MKFLADFHIHSYLSRATSRQCDLENLWAWAQIKGISVIGTGDFTHPEWYNEISTKLEPAQPGLYRLKDEFREKVRTLVPPSCTRQVRFVLTSEISSIYKKGDKTRKVHNLIFAPDRKIVSKINKVLDRIGNIKSDGRPILGLDSRNLLEIVLESSDDCFLVPAHIWTPWFSVLGSKSGFDAIEECYDDLTGHIFALETGLSSDPAMNWRLSGLDRFTLISNSDAHSPGKLGREANRFDCTMDFFAMRDAMRDKTGFCGTIEFFPEEGKYHLDGHRKCHMRMEPGETIKNKGLCPVCGKKVTVGVMARVGELADRKVGKQPEGGAGFTSLVPLCEILAQVLKVGPASKKVNTLYQKLLTEVGCEFSVLMDADADSLFLSGGPLVAEGIGRIRRGDVEIAAGYDGEFGSVTLFSEGEREKIAGQLGLISIPKAKKA